MSIEVMKQALKALEEAHPKPYSDSVLSYYEAIPDLRAAIEDAEKQEPVEPVELEVYDAGILSCAGGGNVSWWLDYIRSELGSAYEYYKSQITTPPAAQPATEESSAAAAPVQEPVGHLIMGPRQDFVTTGAAGDLEINVWYPVYATPPVAPVQEPSILRAEDVIVETYPRQQGGCMFRPESGIRLIHKPTGKVVHCDSESTIHKNKEVAFRELERLLTKAIQEAEKQEPVGRTDQEIVDQTEALAVWLMSWGFSLIFEPEPNAPIRKSSHPIAKRCWSAACHIQEMLTATDPENSVASLDVDATDPEKMSKHQRRK